MTEKGWTEEDEQRVIEHRQEEKQEWREALKHASSLKHFMSREGHVRIMGGYDSDIAKMYPWMEDIFEMIQGRLEVCFEQDRDDEFLDVEEVQGVNP